MQEKRPRSTTISSTTVSSMPPGAPGALPVLPLGMCWQLQDGPDYHLSWGRGQGRLRRCGGVLWAFKRRKCVEIAKRALLGHLGLERPTRRDLTPRAATECCSSFLGIVYARRESCSRVARVNNHEPHLISICHL